MACTAKNIALPLGQMLGKVLFKPHTRFRMLCSKGKDLPANFKSSDIIADVDEPTT